MKLPRRRFATGSGCSRTPGATLASQTRRPTIRPCCCWWAPRRRRQRHRGAAHGQMVAERLGQQFIIENRPGAGSNIATEAVVRATADGYTLL